MQLLNLPAALRDHLPQPPGVLSAVGWLERGKKGGREREREREKEREGGREREREREKEETHREREAAPPKLQSFGGFEGALGTGGSVWGWVSEGGVTTPQSSSRAPSSLLSAPAAGLGFRS